MTTGPGCGWEVVDAELTNHKRPRPFGPLRHTHQDQSLFTVMSLEPRLVRSAIRIGGLQLAGDGPPVGEEAAAAALRAPCGIQQLSGSGNSASWWRQGSPAVMAAVSRSGW